MWSLNVLPKPSFDSSCGFSFGWVVLVILMSNIISHSPFYIQAHRRTAVRVMVEPIITPPRCKYNPLFTFCEFCVAKSARMVFDSFAPFSTGRWWKLWKTKPCTACFFAVFPFLTQESSRVFHAFHGVFNISTVDNPYTRWITFPEYTECERYVKLYRQKKLDANNSPII